MARRHPHRGSPRRRPGRRPGSRAPRCARPTSGAGRPSCSPGWWPRARPRWPAPATSTAATRTSPGMLRSLGADVRTPVSPASTPAARTTPGPAGGRPTRPSSSRRRGGATAVRLARLLSLVERRRRAGRAPSPGSPIAAPRRTRSGSPARRAPASPRSCDRLITEARGGWPGGARTGRPSRSTRSPSSPSTPRRPFSGGRDPGRPDPHAGPRHRPQRVHPVDGHPRPPGRPGPGGPRRGAGPRRGRDAGGAGRDRRRGPDGGGGGRRPATPPSWWSRPGWGDSLQATKAGLLEVADLFVVNKADRPGGRRGRAATCARCSSSRRSASGGRRSSRRSAPTAGAWPSCGRAVAGHRAYLAESGQLARRRGARLEEELRRVLAARPRGARWRELVAGPAFAEARPGRAPRGRSTPTRRRTGSSGPSGSDGTLVGYRAVDVDRVRPAGNGRAPGATRERSTGSTPRPSDGPADPDAPLVPARRVLRGAPARLLRRQQRRHRRPRRACARSSTTSQWLGIDCLWLLPFYPSPHARRRLRHQRLLQRRTPTTGRWATSHGSARRRPPPGHPLRRRPRHEPHERPAPLVHRVALEPRQPQGRLVRVERRRPALARGPRRLHRRRAVQLDLGRHAASSTTGTASTPTSPTSTTRTPRSPTTMVELVRFWLDLGFDGFRLDAVALPLPARRHGRRAPPRDPRLHPADPQADRGRATPGRVLLAEANGWPADVADYFGDGDECHLCFHFPLMPRLFMAVRTRAALPDHRDPVPDPRDPRRVPVGDLPAQPRRADPRAGERGGARLPVRRVRQGPADEAPHGHRAPPRPAARRRPPPRRAALRARAVAAREPGHLLRRRAA